MTESKTVDEQSRGSMFSGLGLAFDTGSSLSIETDRGNAVSGVTISDVESDGPSTVFVGEDAAGVPVKISGVTVDSSVRSLKLSRGRQSAPYGEITNLLVES